MNAWITFELEISIFFSFSLFFYRKGSLMCCLLVCYSAQLVAKKLGERKENSKLYIFVLTVGEKLDPHLYCSKCMTSIFLFPLDLLATKQSLQGIYLIYIFLSSPDSQLHGKSLYKFMSRVLHLDFQHWYSVLACSSCVTLGVY